MADQDHDSGAVPQGVSRRDLMWGAAVAAAATAAVPAMTAPAEAAMGKGSNEVNVRPDGTYDTVPLTKDSWTLAVIQARVRAVDEKNAKQSRKANLDHMLDLIDTSQSWGGKKDLLFFHEFPVTGYHNRWTRDDIIKHVAIELPGPEVDAIGKKAKEHGCYVVFGSYVKDKSWPNHVLSITTIVGPDGTIVDKHWKVRNIKGVFQGMELFTTTVYDVLDEFIERYGLDAVVPVTKTPIGNLATSSIQREPEFMRALAMKGAEVILRTATGGFTPADIQTTSLYNGVYTAVCNNAVSPDNPGFFDDAGSGGSAIYGPRGETLAEADGKFEQAVTTRIPIAEFRKRHRLPLVHWALYAPVFAKYQANFPPGLFSKYLPKDGMDSANYLKDKGLWK